MTHQEAVNNITWLYATYVSRYEVNLRDLVRLFDAYVEQAGWSVRDAYDEVTAIVLYEAAFFDEAFPGHVPEIGKAFDENAIPHDLVLDYFYPLASTQDRDALLAQMEDGAISNGGFVRAWPFVARNDARPDVVRVLEAVMRETGSAPALPRAELDMAGLPDETVDFLISLYMASFGRAPEYAGLHWWAGEAQQMLEDGATHADMTRDVAVRMYDGGVGQGEAGTSLVHAAYVDQAYLNVLGRQADDAGRDFWVAQLEQGLERGEFVAGFLAGTRNEDREYLNARIEVARHVAQEHVSGPGMPPIDLHLVLEGVGNPVQAYAAIQEILHRYRERAPEMPEEIPESAWPALWEGRALASDGGRELSSTREYENQGHAEALIVGLAADVDHGLALG